MKKRTVSFAAAVLLMAMTVLVFSKPVMANGVSDVRNCVAPIAIFLEYADPSTRESVGMMSLGSGTCFFVGDPDKDPHCLVTNYHVAQYYLQYGKGDWIQDTATINGVKYNVLERITMRVYLSKTEYVEAYPITSSAYDETRDIAFLRTNNPIEGRKAVRFLEPSDELTSQHVYCIGYPGIAENSYADPVSAWGIEDATIVDGVISRFVTQTGTGTRFIQSTANFSPGHSGSPMVTEDGYVIGMNTWLLSDSTNAVFYSVDARDIMNLMDSNNIKYAMAGESSGTDVGDTTGQPPQETTVTPASSPAVPAGALIAVVVIVVAAAAAVIAIVLSNRKKNASGGTNSASAGASSEKSGDKEKTPLVRSLSVQHNGERVTLKGRQILIGRDASANIRFKEGTPGVSSRHCNVSYDEATGDFLVTDLKSSYGTFLANGEKLEAGQVYKLKAGDTFYLGEKQNELRVELG